MDKVIDAVNRQLSTHHKGDEQIRFLPTWSFVQRHFPYVPKVKREGGGVHVVQLIDKAYGCGPLIVY